MEQNKTGKYLKYAIGEIVLVVIGILIALTINNWNVDRLNKDYEHKMLSEVIEDLKLDTILLQSQFRRIQMFEMSVDSILNRPSVLMENDADYRLFGGVYLIQNTKALETMKSGGVQIPFNDNLRKQINSHYHNAQFLLDLLSLEDKNFFEFRAIPIQKGYFKIIRDPDSEEFDIDPVPIDYKATIESQEFNDYLLFRKSRIKRWKQTYDRIYDSTIKCMDSIRLYLENSK